MYSSDKYGFYKKWISSLKSTVFYNSNLGLFYAGNVIQNLIPATVIVQNKDNAIHSSFLHKVLIHTSTNKQDIHKVVEFIRSLGFVPIVRPNYDVSISGCVYQEDSVYSDPNSIFIVSMCSDVKQRISECNTYDILLESQKNFVSTSEIGTSSGRIFRVVEYDTNIKPLKHKLYDSMLYAEKWSLLTTREKILRCCFTIFFAPTVIVPIILLLSYIGHRTIQKESYNVNLLSWQYREYNKGVRTTYNDILDDNISSTKGKKFYHI